MRCTFAAWPCLINGMNGMGWDAEFPGLDSGLSLLQAARISTWTSGLAKKKRKVDPFS